MSKSSLAYAALPIPVMDALAVLGRRIRFARKRRDLSLRELAEQAGISSQSVAKMERGEPSIALSLVVDVMVILDLGLDIEELARSGDGDEGPEWKKDVEARLSCMSFEEKTSELLRRFGARLKKIRTSRKLTIAHMTNCMYVSPVTVRKLEHGSPSISLGMAVAALACLDRDEDLQKLAVPAHDKIGIALDAFKHDARQRVRGKKRA
jgi:transcriptional regulator with XRE-family HTH domain